MIKEAESRKFRKLGILGTKFLMEGPVYRDVTGIRGMDHLIPLPEQRTRINDIIFNELVYGMIARRSKDYFHEVIKDLKSEGCDAVVLGCTEIPLIVLPEESPLPSWIRQGSCKSCPEIQPQYPLRFFNLIIKSLYLTLIILTN